ncbi:MAG: hypothetical protein ACI8P9_003263 [Parasphingorhabdus sp.]|jgi:hypothetical protein
MDRKAREYEEARGMAEIARRQGYTNLAIDLDDANLRAESEDIPDDVNRPRHYCGHPSGVECIEVVEHMNFCLGNAMKYIWRARPQTDLFH